MVRGSAVAVDVALVREVTTAEGVITAKGPTVIVAAGILAPSTV